MPPTSSFDHAVERQIKRLPVRRRDERRAVRCPALIHCRGRFQRVMVVDFSALGVGLEGAFGLTEGDSVLLEVVADHCFEGKVGWSLGSRVGVVFRSAMSVYDPAHIRFSQMADGTAFPLLAPVDTLIERSSR